MTKLVIKVAKPKQDPKPKKHAFKAKQVKKANEPMGTCPECSVGRDSIVPSTEGDGIYQCMQCKKYLTHDGNQYQLRVQSDEPETAYPGIYSVWVTMDDNYDHYYYVKADSPEQAKEFVQQAYTNGTLETDTDDFEDFVIHSATEIEENEFVDEDSIARCKNHGDVILYGSGT